MKTVINQYNDICRLSDDEAAETVRLNYGWEYVAKSEWKERERAKKERQRTEATGESVETRPEDQGSR